jgi:hypothetical protein
VWARSSPWSMRGIALVTCRKRASSSVLAPTEAASMIVRARARPIGCLRGGGAGSGAAAAAAMAVAAIRKGHITRATRVPVPSSPFARAVTASCAQPRMFYESNELKD